jgi:outer membrane scaffolding protein for murein synthesis (MipA/OmpV family)
MKLARYLIALALVSSCAIANENTNGDGLLGAALRSRPRYDGADQQKGDLVPVVRYSHGAWFARTTHGLLEGGARFAMPGGLAAGVQVAHEAGPLDEDPGGSLGAHVDWTAKLGPAPLNFLARLRKHTESERGRQLDARATMGIYGSRSLRAGVFAQATWATEQHLLAYYGVADSGLLYTSGGLLSSYELGTCWLALGSAELRRLADAPARGAFVQERTNAYLTAGIGYRF